jgi:NAD(P)H-flavin reductase
MTIETAGDVARTYTSPGQYVEVRIQQQSGFFVLASEPGAAAWELVMRSGGGVSDVLLAAVPGIPIDVTEAIGAGFPMTDVRGRPLTLALAGTGIAAGPPIVRRRILDGDAARTRVFAGIRARAELPMRSELEAWMGAGVSLLVCLSQGPGPIEGIPFAQGYVQDVLRARSALSGRSDCRVFAVGLPSMVAAIRDLARESGLSPERVCTNH